MLATQHGIRLVQLKGGNNFVFLYGIFLYIYRSKMTSMRCLAPSSLQFSLWEWLRNWRSASNGITRDLDMSTPAELQKMEAAAIASNTFFLSLRVLKSVRSTELFLVWEPARKEDRNPLMSKGPCTNDVSTQGGGGLANF